jgi:hypothetical protein
MVDSTTLHVKEPEIDVEQIEEIPLHCSSHDGYRRTGDGL